MNQFHFSIPQRNRKNRGVALVIILAFVVLLTGLVVAFFSRTTTERQVSNSSASQAKADILARSATDIIIGDLKQEIADPSASSSATPASGVTIYTPKASAYMVPLRNSVSSPSPSATPPLANLIRISMYQDPLASSSPYKAVKTAASNVNSTKNPSLNGRSISLARWNSHYLLPRFNPSSISIDSTPPSPLPSPYNPNTAVSNGFTPPDWVMVTTNGPTAQTTPDPTTVGRYAYAIYDEGGLLDVNVAGYPSPSPTPTGTPVPPYKSSLAYADLSLLPTSATGTVPSTQVNNLVGWRNFATTNPSGSLSGNYAFNALAATRYNNYILSASNGFLSINPQPSPSPVTATSRTDQVFTSRQALLRFRRATGLSQNVLQYLGTFSRDLNQPSFAPAPGRPKVQAQASGGNLAYSFDNTINPSFLSVRVQTTKASGRNDGSALTQGEPLVKKRFATFISLSLFW